jgi:tRNA(Ile)-lysidine synthase
MVAFRKFVPDPVAQAPDDGALEPALVRSVADALLALPGDAPVAVALSGGADSAALAIVTAAVCKKSNRPLYFFHIHHGLFAQADTWAEQVSALARQLDIPLDLQEIQVAQDSGLGIEGAAREGRYAALAAMAAARGVQVLLLAHHRQDQAETVLLRLLRGAGVHGLAAMQTDTERQGLRLIRPWLDTERAMLLELVQRYTAQTGWQPVQDPSNTDPHYARGALRAEMLPVLQAYWPAWQQTLGRHARQAAEAIEVLDEVAQSDLAGLDPRTEDGSFCLRRWRALSPARQALVLRYWLQSQGVAMPGDRRLADLLRQLRQLHALGHDRDLLWQHGAVELRCRQGRVLLLARQP